MTPKTQVATDIDYEKSRKQQGYLRVPSSHNDAAWANILIPITVMKNGAGPTLLALGGNHGDEYEGPIALMKLARDLTPDEVRGRIIIIPALNLPAVRAGTRLSPVDRLLYIAAVSMSINHHAVSAFSAEQVVTPGSEKLCP